MKRLVWAAILLVIVVCGCLWGMNSVETMYSDMYASLSEAYSYAEVGDMDKAAETSEKLELMYIDSEKSVSFFIHHSLTEELGVSISKLAPLARNDSEEFMPECKAAMTTLVHIRNDQKLKLKNIM